MQADILRDKFLAFFRARHHKIAQSDSLVPSNDPTVLFTPAGMNQFKKQFLGYICGFTRAASSQRCLRTDDLDKVGKTAGHHTFFEMLGNFSFGDYFKKEAISYAWEFLTEELKIKNEKLWVSVYKDDREAYNIWKDIIKVPKEKIIKLGDKENFWPSEAKEKGPNGPCGPCSEIFFDQGETVGCKRPDCNPSCDCGRFVEVWNLVFTQFDRKEGGMLEPLPKKNIDTGMGLERLAAVMQGVKSNFETDLFKPLVKEINSAVSCQLSADSKELIYAIADHIRAIVFAIYDGVMPANEARGYCVRKIIRKSIIHLMALGIKQPFLYKLVPVLSEIMKKPYPEMDARRENIAEIILAEEKNFISVLTSSDALFKEKFSKLLDKPDTESAGKIAFQLYDTYGIPLELTKNWLAQQNIKISQAAYDFELDSQKLRSRAQSTMKGDVFDIKGLGLGVKATKFLGYKDCVAKAKILKIIKQGRELKKIEKNDTAEIILDKTPFYPESGGQASDTGELVNPALPTRKSGEKMERKGGVKGKNVFEVIDTQKINKVIIHTGKVKEGSFKKSDFVSSRINAERRLSIARNHTATHLLQAALRKVLGVHVQQQGSCVLEDRLRFDFTHFKDIEKSQLDRIEEVVNNYIMSNYRLHIKQLIISEAKREGALAFFGDKYENKVRMVSIGDFSKELCAGTHLDSTSQIGLFKITQEGSVARGIRRIEAVTGSFAYKMIKKEEAGIFAELQKRLNRIKELEKQLSSQKLDSLKASIDEYIKKGEFINNINVITLYMKDVDNNYLRRTVDLIKEKTKNTVIATSAEGTSGEVSLVIGVTSDLCERINASKVIKEIAPEIGGSGGGRRDFAQAGGNKPQNLEKAYQKLKNLIKNLT